MRRRLIGACGAVLVFAALAAPAAAQEVAQPSQGERSAGRNPQGVGGGPHCHVVVAASEHVAASAAAPFEHISVMPSHTGHVATNTAQGAGAVFLADPDCNGVPGQQQP